MDEDGCKNCKHMNYYGADKIMRCSLGSDKVNPEYICDEFQRKNIKTAGVWMENKDGLCEAEVRKNLVLAEIGEPLTLPLATLNRSCNFNKEWTRVQRKWNKKKVVCVCGKEFRVSRGRYKYCSLKCSEIQRKIIIKAYRKRPDMIAKAKAYFQSPTTRARAKAYSKRPEVIARRKAYMNKPEVKAATKARQRDPEVKARARIRARVYNQRPEVIARRKAYRLRPEVKAMAKATYEKKREKILQKHRKKYAIDNGLEIKYYNIFELLEKSY